MSLVLGVCNIRTLLSLSLSQQTETCEVNVRTVYVYMYIYYLRSERVLCEKLDDLLRIWHGEIRVGILYSLSLAYTYSLVRVNCAMCLCAFGFVTLLALSANNFAIFRSSCAVRVALFISIEIMPSSYVYYVYLYVCVRIVCSCNVLYFTLKDVSLLFIKRT